MQAATLNAVLVAAFAGSLFAGPLFSSRLLASDNQPTLEQVEFFEQRIRPLLVNHCQKCHGADKQSSGLSLESAAKVLAGGDSGPIIVEGKPDESLLIQAVRRQGELKMPPDEPLSKEQIDDLVAWVAQGAPWAPDADAPNQESAITDEDRQFWSFRPVVRHPTPSLPDAFKGELPTATINDVPPPAPPLKEGEDENAKAREDGTAWIIDRGPIDRFVLAELALHGLHPSPRADRRTLIRRASFDLTGLPPSPAEVAAFLQDRSPDAFERVVDRLLASPMYGERWGRHWLDVARYAEDQAHTFEARSYTNGFRYRDWVIDAFNRDLPYDRFIMEQIAGDLLGGPDVYARNTALGFFALGPVYYKDAGCAEKAAADELDDRVDTLARGFLALTVACARCHDHKFDPITQQDYYALAGVFSSSQYREAPLVADEVVQAYKQAQQRIEGRQAAVDQFIKSASIQMSEAAVLDVARYLVAAWKLRHSPEPADASALAKLSGLKEPILKRWYEYLVQDNRPAIPGLEEWIKVAAVSPAPQQDAGPNAEPGEAPPAGEVDVPADVTAAAAAFQQRATAALLERRSRDEEYAKAVEAAAEAEKANVPKPELDPAQADLLSALLDKGGLCAVKKDQVEELLNESQQAELAALRKELADASAAAPAQFPFAHALEEGTVADLPLAIRGNHTRPGPVVPRRFLEILSTGDLRPFEQGSGRLELARAIASRDNPLTARVIVNRVWQHHFGRGIVGTPSNFGALGERPSHPALLDYLAGRLIEQGWSLKALHREILLSATWQQVSDHNSARNEIDPENQFLWRGNRRRLDVEAWRDGLLSVTDSLDRILGGPSTDLAAAENHRRTVYGSVSRHNLDGLLRLFDFPDPNITSPGRIATTVPLQQLFVLNSDFLVSRARALSRWLAVELDPETRIKRAFELLYGRPPEPEEVAIGLEFVNSANQPAESESEPNVGLTAWEQYFQALLGANEFTYVD